jgi:hypothetical protein
MDFGQTTIPRSSDLILPETGLVDALGQAITTNPQPVGLDVYEATNGLDTLQAQAEIRRMRLARERLGRLVVAVGMVTPGLLEEVALFNAEAYAEQDAARELTPGEKETIRAAVTKRERKRARRAAQVARQAR